MRYLRAQDEFHLNSSTTANPMQIGTVMLLDVPAAHAERALHEVLAHLEATIPASSLALRLERSPWDIAPRWWRRVSQVDVRRHIRLVRGRISRDELRDIVASEVMVKVDPSQCAFRGVLVEHVEGAGTALILLVHHSLVDGIGFQRLMSSLTDPMPQPAHDGKPSLRDQWLPPGLMQLPLAARYLAAQSRQGRNRRDEIEQARAALRLFNANPDNAQPKGPELSLCGPSSARRSYDFISLPLATFHEIRRVLKGSVNDVFLATAGGALRSFLLDQNELPEAPLVALAARSHRRDADGDLGNFILSLQPHIGTHIADPVERFRAVQESMRRAIDRSYLIEPLTEATDKPFGARERRRRLVAKSSTTTKSVFGANIALSNVPGPDKPRYLGGHRVLASYPTPIVGSGRFLNLTLRRYCDMLDVGVMVDGEKIPDASVISDYVRTALEELRVVAASLAEVDINLDVDDSDAERART